MQNIHVQNSQFQVYVYEWIISFFNTSWAIHLFYTKLKLNFILNSLACFIVLFIKIFVYLTLFRYFICIIVIYHMIIWKLPWPFRAYILLCKMLKFWLELHYQINLDNLSGFSWWLNGKEPICQCKRHGFDPWVGKLPLRRKWQLTAVFLPGNPMDRRSLEGYSPWGHKRVRHDLATKWQPFFLIPYLH